MAERTYTTKTRAKRIALDYFKRPHPFRRAKLLLSIALPALAAVVVLAYAVRKDHRMYNSGPVSTAHAMFGARCEHCHAPAPTAAGATPSGAFFVPVADRTCSVCHEGPIHHDNQAFKPPCTSCHFEHKGRILLVNFGDRQCTQCHDGLTTKEGRPAFERKITGLQAGHPEFSVTLTRKTIENQAQAKTGVTRKKPEERVKLGDQALRDTGELCLNHETHLKPNRFPRDETWYHDRPGVIDSRKDPRLGCTYCHEADGQRAYMTPVNYAKHCAECHPLEFDNVNYPNVKAPHKEPEIVRAFLRKTYAEPPAKAAAKAPAESEEKEPTARGGRRFKAAAESKEEEPTTRGSRRFKAAADEEPDEGPKRGGGGFKNAEAAETALFLGDKNNTCVYCHALAAPGDASTRASCSDAKKPRVRAAEEVRAALKKAGDKLPEVVPTNMQERWLPHSRFSHRAHRPFECAACHDKTKTSTKTADVLLPMIDTCRKCHAGVAGARAACVECHVYHDKKKERGLDGPLKLENLALGGRARAGGGSR